jgi:hypothetical protein
MSSSLLYRIAAILLVLFAIGHTLGFRNTKGMEGADTVVALMQSVHFTVQGARRALWDFYVGFGLFVTVFLLFSAILAWQLGGLPSEVLVRMPAVTWGLAVCLLVVAALSWTNFFAIPAVLSTAITLCLFAAAWLSARV